MTWASEFAQKLKRGLTGEQAKDPEDLTQTARARARRASEQREHWLSRRLKPCHRMLGVQRMVYALIAQAECTVYLQRILSACRRYCPCFPRSLTPAAFCASGDDDFSSVRLSRTTSSRSERITTGLVIHSSIPLSSRP